MDKIKNILQFAMKMERQGQIFYEFYEDQVKNPQLKQLFGELAEVEKEHYQILKDKYEELLGEKDLQVISWVVDDNSKLRNPLIFTSHDDVLSFEESLEDITVLRMAYLIENDFAEFYNYAKEAVNDEKIKAFLEVLSSWEEQHRDLFYNQYQLAKIDNWNQVIENILA